METTHFGVQLTSTIDENGVLSFSASVTDNGPPLSGYYIEVWTANGATIDGETFQEHVLADTVYEADPVTLSVDDTGERDARPVVRIIVFENRGSSGEELFRHEHRLFTECGQWHYVSS